MTEEEIAKIRNIEDKLIEYFNGNPAYPNMLLFSSINHFDTADVAAVIRGSDKLNLSKCQKDMLLNTFVKRDPFITAKSTPIAVETFKEFSKNRKKKIRKAFANNPDLTVQDFLSTHSDISEAMLRNILDKETWEKHYVYKKHAIDWDSIVELFREDESVSVDAFCEEQKILPEMLRQHITKEEWEQRKEYVRGPRVKKDWPAYVEVLKSMPDKSCSEFCKEQGLPYGQFKKNCPKDVWDAHVNIGKTNWDVEIEAMKKSGKSYQEYCKDSKIPVQTFRNHCPDAVLEEFDAVNMLDRKRAEMFDPKIPVKENAEKLGMSQAYMSMWLNSKLKEIAPEKFEAMHAYRTEAKKTPEQLQIEELESQLTAVEADYLKKIDLLMHQIDSLKEALAKKETKIGELSAANSSLRVTLDKERQKNSKLAKSIREFADSLEANG